MFFFGEIQVFLALFGIGLFWNKQSLYTPQKNITCWKYSFNKLDQFSQANKVIDDSASNKDGFLGVRNVFLHLS
jgi:hypothetical protein